MKTNEKIAEQVKVLKRHINDELTQQLIPKRFIPEIPAELEGKNVRYVFDSSDSFNLTYDELLEIVTQSRQAGNLVPVLGTVS